MKQSAVNITALFVASIIFLTGMGTMVVNFCCDGCLSEFLSASPAPAENKSCCAESSSAHNGNQEQEHSQDCGCKIEWQASLLDSYHYQPSVMKPYEWNGILLQKLLFTTPYTESADADTEKQIKPPPENLFKTRDYLSFIQTFII